MFHIDLSGKNAIITGAGSGVGLKSAEFLAQAGANVAVCDINGDTVKQNAKRIAGEYGVKTLSGMLNVSDENQVDAFVQNVYIEWEKIDILVNAAGISFGIPPVEVPSRRIRKLFEVNVFGTININRAVLQYMMFAKSGKIINIASVAGKMPDNDLLYYAMANAAVIAHTRGLAQELGKYNININNVCPGVIRTPMKDKMTSEGNAETYKLGTEYNLMGRPQTEEDIAGMVLYLSSNLADNITAQSINVDGGFSVY